MIKDEQELKTLLQREGVHLHSEDELLQKGEERLAWILECEAGANAKEFAWEIKAIISADDGLKRKVLSYCLDFYDPMVTHSARGTEIYNTKGGLILKYVARYPSHGKRSYKHAFLPESELQKIYRFVKKHQHDNTFGEVVFRIMDKHGMTAPQVYKNALLRRQDFSRVTDFRCKSVTRRMAWQIIVGLHCTLEEADEVLFSAGYVRGNNTLDITVQYFIENGNYDIEAIDAVLSEFGLKTFACD